MRVLDELVPGERTDNGVDLGRRDQQQREATDQFHCAVETLEDQTDEERPIQEPVRAADSHVTEVTLSIVTDNVNWVLIFVQLPSEPSRHRVGVWRELRKGGAVPISQGAWVVPDAPAFHTSLERAERLTRTGGGTFALVDARPRTDAGRSLMRDAFVAARRDEWNEFQADCGKYEDEIAKETATHKFTFGELEEEEQSLDRLRRWYRDLKKRDILALPEANAAEARLRHCEDILTQYAEMVYQAMRGNAPASTLPAGSGAPE